MTGSHDSLEIKGDFIHQALSFKNQESCPILECVCVCECAGVFVCACVCVGLCAHACVCMPLCLHYMCVCVGLCVHACVRMPLCLRYMCVCWVHVCGGETGSAPRWVVLVATWSDIREGSKGLG